jgi:hypothetical protein
MLASKKIPLENWLTYGKKNKASLLFHVKIYKKGKDAWIKDKLLYSNPWSKRAYEFLPKGF